MLLTKNRVFNFCDDDFDEDSYEYIRQQLIDSGIWDWDD
jgi:hypothetical protein